MSTTGKMDLMDKLLGKSDDVFGAWRDPAKKMFFFKSYQSFSDAAFRFVSVISAPLIFGVFSTLFISLLSLSLMNTLYYAIINNTFTAETYGKDCLTYSSQFLQLVAMTVASPIINLVDLIGGGVASLMLLCEKPSNDDKNNSIEPTI